MSGDAGLDARRYQARRSDTGGKRPGTHAACRSPTGLPHGNAGASSCSHVLSRGNNKAFCCRVSCHVRLLRCNVPAMADNLTDECAMFRKMCSAEPQSLVFESNRLGKQRITCEIRCTGKVGWLCAIQYGSCKSSLRGQEPTSLVGLSKQSKSNNLGLSKINGNMPYEVDR